MRRANHHPTDVDRHGSGLLQQRTQGGDNATGHVSRGGRFDPTDDLLALHQHSVGVRAPYINTYALLHLDSPTMPCGRQEVVTLIWPEDKLAELAVLNHSCM